MEENSEPRRRWFRFSLRTMLVLVTVIAILLTVLAHPIHAIRARRTFRAAHAGCVIQVSDNYPVPLPPWPLYLLGEGGVACWDVKCLSKDDDEEARRLFPESQLISGTYMED